MSKQPIIRVFVREAVGSPLLDFAVCPLIVRFLAGSSSASFDLHKKAVIAYVERSSYPKLQGATEADMSFKEGGQDRGLRGHVHGKSAL
ncbi:hypothetical protein [Xanthomonas sp. BRIP62415]|uniref:hypothetical protein n=1 Tax=Xanthomonas sp. BRIP62415 TaxID=2182390 RepID=UPI0013DECA5E|nr:hypothetical protein [Xanthomonas sp. BRIP62415]